MEEGMSGFCIRPLGGGGGGGGGGTKCGRWSPTNEQVKVLTDLFRSGLRTPSTDQIQKISAQLSFYGKIESKNVFYWFQNHKARERQKRRRVSFAAQNENHVKDTIASTNNFAEINQVSEPKRMMETLQLFPLNSFSESESDKLRLFANECKETKPFSYTYGSREIDHPPLDLHLRFL